MEFIKCENNCFIKLEEIVAVRVVGTENHSEYLTLRVELKNGKQKTVFSNNSNNKKLIEEKRDKLLELLEADIQEL